MIRRVFAAFALLLVLRLAADAGAAPPPAEHAVRALTARGVAAATAARAARHVLLGLPAGARPGEDLLVRDRYVLSFDRARKGLSWASWSLTDTDFGSFRRKDFRGDLDVPEAVRVERHDYSGSGWTKGHMVPSGETTSDPQLNASTYLMTNIFPQALSVNGGPWNRLENYYRDLVRFEGKDAYLIGGSIFRGPLRTIGRNVHVPSANFKIVVVLDRGQTLADVTEKTRVIAAIVPNSNDVSEKARWAGYRTSVAEIEKQTGLRFFAHLPTAVAQALRAKVDADAIPDGDHPGWTALMNQQGSPEGTTASAAGP